MLLKNKSVPTSFPQTTSWTHCQNLHACLTRLIMRLLPSVWCKPLPWHPEDRLGLHTVNSWYKAFSLCSTEGNTGAQHVIDSLPCLPSSTTKNLVYTASRRLTPSTWGLQPFHIMLGWSLIFLRFAYAHRRKALICLLLAERHPSPKQVIIYCEAFPGSAVSSLGRVLAPVTRLHRNDMISKAFQAYIIPIIQR